MKKSTVMKTAALAAAGIAGWYLTGNSRKGQGEKIRREVHRLRSVRRDELEALRDAAKNGELAADALGPVPLDGADLDAVRLEDGAAVLVLRGGRAAASKKKKARNRHGFELLAGDKTERVAISAC